MIQADCGYNPKNIVFVGDSAGGGAVAAAAIQLQREKVPLPAALGMFSPWVDLAGHGDTAVTLNAVDPIIPGRDPFDQQGSVNGLALAYVGGNTTLASSDPLVSPVLADWASLFPDSTLPPVLIQVGLRETLLSDSVRLYHGMRKAAPAPGRVLLSPYEGMWHVFQGYGFVPEAVDAGQEMGGFLRAVLDGQVGCK
jgi:acetyl esterase/lipase